MFLKHVLKTFQHDLKIIKDNIICITTNKDAFNLFWTFFWCNFELPVSFVYISRSHFCQFSVEISYFGVLYAPLFSRLEFYVKKCVLYTPKYGRFVSFSGRLSFTMLFNIKQLTYPLEFFINHTKRSINNPVIKIQSPCKQSKES